MNEHTAAIITDLSSHLLVRARDEFEEVEFVESVKLFLEIANTLNEEDKNNQSDSLLSS